MPSRNNIEIEIRAKDSASGVVQQVGDRLDKFGSGAQRVGGAITALAGPAAAAFGLATASAVAFDESVTNIGAVAGLTRDEIAAMKDTLLDMSEGTRAGPQAVAEAMYDIVGGVADATTHMDILRHSIALSEAGNSSLAGTTSALIAVMNSYKFSADQASYASDVLTSTVGMGVGSMEAFASALPQVTGLASSLGISFGDLGAMTAYLTTQGNTASQATTQLAAMMTALLNPNEAMKAGLQELGFATGQAAIEALGLDGTYAALAGTQTASEQGMAKMAGSVEALRGATALAGPDVDSFMTTFTEGINGATAAAQAVQMESAAAQFDTLKTSVSMLAIETGDALIPAMLDLVEQARPVIDSVIEWVRENPELVSQIAILAGGATVLGGGLMILGGIISSVGTVLGVLHGAITIGSTLFGALTGTSTAAAGGMGAAGAAATGAMAPLAAMAAPIVAITAAAVAAIAALKQLIDTINMVNAAKAAAQDAYSSNMAAGNITDQNVYDTSFNAISSQFGGGVVGDVAARLFYTNTAKAVGARAGGGDVESGNPYIVGEEGPELFVPGQSGTIVPNDALGGGGIQIGSLVIHANSEAEGRAAAKGFNEQLREQRRAFA